MRNEQQRPNSPSDQQWRRSPRAERHTDPACPAFPSPRPSPAGSPPPCDGRGVRGEGNGRAGRGRNVGRVVKEQARLIVRNVFKCCSLSHRERVRVRRNHRNSDPAYLTTPGIVELRESSGRYLFTVAQIFNLPYRRFVIGKRLPAGGRWQVKNLRYSRLQVCATGAASTLSTCSGRAGGFSGSA